MNGRAGLLLAALAMLAALVPFAGLRAAEDGVPPVRPSPWALAATPDGETLFVSMAPAGTVAVIDVAARRVRARWDVGGTPRGLAVSRDGSTLAVSLGPEDEVVLVDTSSGDVRARATCDRDPEGLAFAADGRRLFVANKLSGDVATLEVATARVRWRAPAGLEPFAASLSADGGTLAAVSRRATTAGADALPAAEVTLVDTRSGDVRLAVPLPSCHLSEAAAFTPDGRYLLVPAIRVRNLLPIVQVARGWVLSSVLAVVEVAEGDVSLMPLQYPNAGFADPTGIAVSDDGQRAYVASGGGNEVAVIDLPALLRRLDEGRPDRPERFSITRDYLPRRVRVGNNPRGLVWLGRGAAGRVAVSNRLDDDVMLLDREGSLVARIPLGPPVPDDAIQRGRRAFFDASYCFQHAFSCTSCHPEGHTDGLTYDFEIDGVGRNPLLNRSLRGLAGTAPFKWSGLNPSLQRQCGARFAMVLTRADPFPLDVLDDLAAYLLSLPPPNPTLDARAGDEATRAAIERGRLLFERSRRKDGTPLRPGERCITCHPPPRYTNNQPTDVGTRGPLDDHDAYDVPHLTGAGTKTLYLHDGRAATLEDVLRALGDRHGYVGDLTEADLRDLVLFLKTL